MRWSVLIGTAALLAAGACKDEGAGGGASEPETEEGAAGDAPPTAPEEREAAEEPEDPEKPEKPAPEKPAEPFSMPTPEELEDAAEADRRLCEREWPEMTDSPAALDKKCARYWVIHHGYGGRYESSAFELDPVYGAPAFTRLSAETILELADRVRGYCGEKCLYKESAFYDSRAIELFEASAEYHYALFEANPGAPNAEPLFRAVLAGEPLESAAEAYDVAERTSFEEMVGRLSPMLLRRLRNAVYARHGRRFESADLQAFFYDPEPAVAKEHFPRTLEHREKTGLFPLEVDREFNESMLTRTDRENVQLLRKLEKQAAERY